MADQKTLSYETALSVAMKNIKDREILLWGRDDEFSEYLKNEHGVTVSKFVTTISKKVSENRILSGDLQGKADKYYVILSKDQPSAALRKRLRMLGFTEGRDYIFVKRSSTVLPSGYGKYRDVYGNSVNTGGCRVMLGKYTENCDIFVDEGFRGDFLIRVFGRGNVKVRIGKNCKCAGESRLFIHDDGEFIMGSYVSIGVNNKFSVSRNNRIHVGDDCMFSYDILVFSGDGHAIFDMETGQRTNNYAVSDPKGSITLGRHVWICSGAYILNRANIGDSCIIGANATVKGDVPDYSIAAGNPARIVKRNVTWSRNPDAVDIGECFGGWDGFSGDNDEDPLKS